MAASHDLPSDTTIDDFPKVVTTYGAAQSLVRDLSTLPQQLDLLCNATSLKPGDIHRVTQRVVGAGKRKRIVRRDVKLTKAERLEIIADLRKPLVIGAAEMLTRIILNHRQIQEHPNVRHLASKWRARSVEPVRSWDITEESALAVAERLRGRALQCGFALGLIDLIFTPASEWTGEQTQRHLAARLDRAAPDALRDFAVAFPKSLKADLDGLDVLLRRERNSLQEWILPARAAGGSPASPAITSVNAKNHTIIVNGETFALTPTRFKLVNAIIERRGTLVRLDSQVHKHLKGLPPSLKLLIRSQPGKRGGRSIDPRHVAPDAIGP